MTQSLSRAFLMQFLHRYRKSVSVVIVASLLLNLLVFSGSIYMLLVYDLILPSGSVPTLLGLFAMLAVVYAFQAVFDAVRSEALLSIARGIHRDLGPRIHYASTSRPLRLGKRGGDGAQLIRDLDQVYSFVGSPGPIALIDLPWVAVFMLVLFLLHFWLGVAAMFGMVVMAAIAWISSNKTREGSRDLAKTVAERSARLQAELRFTETAAAMGMRDRLTARSAELDERYRTMQDGLSSIVGRFGGAGRVFRTFLQSLILTVGALLVIDGKASGGIIIASSILGGRALAPVDQTIATWRNLVAATSGWRRIVEAVSTTPPPPAREVQIELPRHRIALRDIWVVPPGSSEPVIKGVSLALEAGQALAVIGPSAAGKTTLVKALLGIWPVARGEVRLDGALHSHWDPELLGTAFGYVPQAVELLEGTVGENIARLDAEATSEAIVAAAQKAGLHEAILALPDGYDTRVAGGGFELSAGQRQRLGLARALYGDPFLLVLDEANSNLDQEGDAALADAIAAHRDRGGIVVMITHRPATLGPVTHVAVMRDGRLADFGEREEVLKRALKPTIQARKSEVAVG